MIVPQIVDDLYAGTMDKAAWNRVFIGIADMFRASATLLSISIHTARTHLKSLYGKTGIRSQAELVRRVLSGPSAYAPTTN
jgi:hypothetical protein